MIFLMKMHNNICIDKFSTENPWPKHARTTVGRFDIVFIFLTSLGLDFGLQRVVRAILSRPKVV